MSEETGNSRRHGSCRKKEGTWTGRGYFFPGKKGKRGGKKHRGRTCQWEGCSGGKPLRLKVLMGTQPLLDLKMALKGSRERGFLIQFAGDLTIGNRTTNQRMRERREFDREQNKPKKNGMW